MVNGLWCCTLNPSLVMSIKSDAWGRILVPLSKVEIERNYYYVSMQHLLCLNFLH